MHTTRTQVLELVGLLRAEVLEETRLGLVATTVHVCEVSGEQIDQSVIVEVAPGGTDRVPSAESCRCGDHSECLGRFGEARLAIVGPEEIGLEAVARDIDIQVTILVEVARGDPPGSSLALGLCQLERLAVFIDEDLVRPGDALAPVLVSPDIEIDESVSVEIAPAGPPGNRGRQLGQLDRAEFHFSIVVIQPPGGPGEQVHQAVVVLPPLFFQTPPEPHTSTHPSLSRSIQQAASVDTLRPDASVTFLNAGAWAARGVLQAAQMNRNPETSQV